jgi:diguanylate cyclase (GGDEF)-like protein/PAS domain S-box-containing protein
MNEIYKLILDSMPEGIYCTDLKRCITYWNREAEKLTGHQAVNIMGASCMDNILVHSDANGTLLCKTACPLAATMNDGKSRKAEVYLLHKDGHRKPVTVRTLPLYDKNGVIIGGIETFTDTSVPLEALRQLDEYREAALIDPLTGVGNRRYTQEQISARLEMLKQGGRPFGLLFSDIDKFKQINDQYLHAAGDLALQMVARTLLGNLRSSDFLGRWGGDEFVVLISDICESELYQVAHKLAALVGVSQLSLNGSGSVRLSISIGYAQADPCDTMESLLERADRSMYTLKKAKTQAELPYA